MSNIKSLLGWSKNYFWTIYYAFVLFIQRDFLKLSWRDSNSILRKWTKRSLQCFSIDVEIYNSLTGCEGQVIIVSNHRSWFDQIAISSILPFNIHYLGKEDYFNIPILRSILKNIEVIPVTNKRLRSDVEILMNSYFQRGDSFFFFLEGTRGSGRELLPFKKGAFKWAAKYKVPLVPVFILGSEEILSKKNSLLSITSGKIILIFQRPIYFTEQKWEEEMKMFETQYRLEHNCLYDYYKESGNTFSKDGFLTKHPELSLLFPLKECEKEFEEECEE